MNLVQIKRRRFPRQVRGFPYTEKGCSVPRGQLSRTAEYGWGQCWNEQKETPPWLSAAEILIADVGYGRIGQSNKKLPNPIRTGTAPATPPTTHFHIPDRMSHCRRREMAASHRSRAASDASRDSSNIQRSSCSNRRRKASGCEQMSQRYKMRVIMPSPDGF